MVIYKLSLLEGSDLPKELYYDSLEKLIAYSQAHLDTIKYSRKMIHCYIEQIIVQ